MGVETPASLRSECLRSLKNPVSAAAPLKTPNLQSLSRDALADNFEFLPWAIADRATLVLLFGFRGVAADRADVKLARGSNPRVQLAGLKQSDCFAIEAGVGLLGLKSSGERADGEGVSVGCGLR